MVAIERTIRFAELLVIIQRGVFLLCTVRLTFRVWRSDHDCSDRLIVVAGDKRVRKEGTNWMQDRAKFASETRPRETHSHRATQSSTLTSEQHQLITHSPDSNSTNTSYITGFSSWETLLCLKYTSL